MLRGLSRRKGAPGDTTLLREFVYLDEVSVYSILASLTGSIATQFTESRQSTVEKELSASIEAGIGLAGVNLGSQMNAGSSEASQVVRKAIVQTSFGELCESAESQIKLRDRVQDHGRTITSVRDISKCLESDEMSNLVLDPSSIRRGDLVEVKVELQAEDIFEVAEFVNTVRDFIEENPQLFDQNVAEQMTEIRAMARMMDSLLGDLVPIRGRLVDYMCIEVEDQEILVHCSVLDMLEPECFPKQHPVFVVGVAERTLFWKDIRRVLFSKAQFSVFCRIAVDGLSESWQPVKLADVLVGIVPSFGESIEGFGSLARGLMDAAVEVVASDKESEVDMASAFIETYCHLLAKEHKRELPNGFDEAILAQCHLPEEWTESVDSIREAFNDITRCVDEALGVCTPDVVASRVRKMSANLVGFSTGIARTETGTTKLAEASSPVSERFLDSEIIAVYW